MVAFLSHRKSPHPDLPPSIMQHYNNPKGTFLAYYLAVIVCFAAFMQGYDSGVAGGVLTMPSFQRDFKYSSMSQTKVNSLTVGLQQLGSVIGTLIAFPLTSHLGRKKCIVVSAITFVVGVIIETVNTHSLTAWYVGRIIAGFGQGGVSIVVPMYSAEMAPKEIRGRLSSMYQWMYTIGIFTSYWADYGFTRGISSSSSKQWQFPVALQLVASGLLLLGIATLKDSARWLVKAGRMHEAWDSLVWVRGGESADTLAEFDEIKKDLQKRHTDIEGRTIGEVLDVVNIKRFTIAALIFMFQQGTGATALAYFAPQFFRLLVGPGDKTLLLTGTFGAVKVIATTIFIVWLADRFARRTVLTGGALFMAFCMLSIGVLYNFRPSEPEALNTAGVATVVLLYLSIVAYNWSWGSIVWALIPEIFPTRIRELGVASAMLSHWIFSFLFTTATPYMLRDMQGWTFLLYAALDVVMAAFTYCESIHIIDLIDRDRHSQETLIVTGVDCIADTKGKSLEQSSDAYHSPDNTARYDHRQRRDDRRSEVNEAAETDALLQR